MCGRQVSGKQLANTCIIGLVSASGKRVLINVRYIYLIVLWIRLFVIEVLFLKGTNGTNNYGPDPLKNEKIQPSESSTIPNHTQ